MIYDEFTAELASDVRIKYFARGDHCRPGHWAGCDLLGSLRCRLNV